MGAEEKVNILLVDDQPGKLLSYEAVLADLGENLLKAQSANQALEFSLYQLRGDTDPIARFAQTSFKNVTDA